MAQEGRRRERGRERPGGRLRQCLEPRVTHVSPQELPHAAVGGRRGWSEQRVSRQAGREAAESKARGRGPDGGRCKPGLPQRPGIRTLSAGQTSKDVEEAAQKPLSARGSPEPAFLKEKGRKEAPRGERNSPGEEPELQLSSYL